MTYRQLTFIDLGWNTRDILALPSDYIPALVAAWGEDLLRVSCADVKAVASLLPQFRYLRPEPEKD